MKKGFVRKIYRSSAEEQIEALLKHLPERLIYVHGRGAENLDQLIRAFRDHDKEREILLGTDLRVFGESRKEILDEVDRLDKLGITVSDVAHPEDTSLAKMIDRALHNIMGSKRIRASKSTASSTGRKGGIARGENAKARRFGNIDDDTARRIWTHPKLTIADKLYLMGPQWTKATAVRQFGKSRNG